MMLPTSQPVTAKQAAHFLFKAYKLKRAGYYGLLSARELGRELGLDDIESRSLCAYLAEKGLIDCPDSSTQFRLSLEGLNELEWALANPCFLHDLLCEAMEGRVVREVRPASIRMS